MRCVKVAMKTHHEIDARYYMYNLNQVLTRKYQVEQWGSQWVVFRVESER